ncbi:MAG: response regulator [Pseudomonadota bacterium]
MDTDPFDTHMPRPSAVRPLLGLTVLVIEDSRFACEAMRLLCLRSGARIRRADSLRAARRHLRVYRPSVVIVDIGLPDGSGLELISTLVEACPRPDVIVGTSGDDGMDAAAMKAGADTFLAKPVTSLAVFQETILAQLPPERRPLGPRDTPQETVHPDPIAFQDDMAHVADVLDELGDPQMLDYIAQFLRGVARSAQDSPLEQAAIALAKTRANGGAAASETAVLAGMVQDRLNQRIAI